MVSVLHGPHLRTYIYSAGVPPERSADINAINCRFGHALRWANQCTWNRMLCQWYSHLHSSQLEGIERTCTLLRQPASESLPQEPTYKECRYAIDMCFPSLLLLNIILEQEASPVWRRHRAHGPSLHFLLEFPRRATINLVEHLNFPRISVN
jgi:hypothetical protein